MCDFPSQFFVLSSIFLYSMLIIFYISIKKKKKKNSAELDRKKYNIERIEFRRENNLRIRLNFLIIFQLYLSLRRCFNAYERRWACIVYFSGA